MARTRIHLADLEVAAQVVPQIAVGSLAAADTVPDRQMDEPVVDTAQPDHAAAAEDTVHFDHAAAVEDIVHLVPAAKAGDTVRLDHAAVVEDIVRAHRLVRDQK